METSDFVVWSSRRHGFTVNLSKLKIDEVKDEFQHWASEEKPPYRLMPHSYPYSSPDHSDFNSPDFERESSIWRASSGESEVDHVVANTTVTEAEGSGQGVEERPEKMTSNAEADRWLDVNGSLHRSVSDSVYNNTSVSGMPKGIDMHNRSVSWTSGRTKYGKELQKLKTDNSTAGTCSSPAELRELCSPDRIGLARVRLQMAACVAMEAQERSNFMINHVDQIESDVKVKRPLLRRSNTVSKLWDGLWKGSSQSKSSSFKNMLSKHSHSQKL